MRKRLIMLFLSLILIREMNAQSRLAPPNDPNASAQSGQSEIIINASNSDKDIAIWINGAIAAHVPPKSKEKIIVHNGRNLVEAADTSSKKNQWDIGSKKQISVESNSDSITIGVATRYGALLNLNIQSTTALGSGGGGTSRPTSTSGSQQTAPLPPPRVAAIAGGTLETAIYSTANTIMSEIPSGSTLAILSVSSSDKDMSEFVIEELTFVMVDAKKYKVVDRKSLDMIRAEHQFQYSGEVDDNSAVSIGKLLGASIVITGSITGTGSSRRLTAKALDVRTAQIVAMGRAGF